MAELTSSELSLKAENTYYLAFCRKRLPTPGLEQQFLKNEIGENRKYQSISHAGRIISGFVGHLLQENVCTLRMCAHLAMVIAFLTVNHCPKKMFFNDSRSR